MAYDSALPLNITAQALAAPSQERGDDFHRAERVVVLAGASAIGTLIGFGAAMAIGRLDLWVVILASAPFMVLALHLTAETLRDGLKRNAYGCATAAGLHVAALLAWPLTSLFAPLSMANFWIAPGVAVTALFLLASCWQGDARGVLRVSALGFLVMTVAAHQGTMLALGA